MYLINKIKYIQNSLPCLRLDNCHQYRGSHSKGKCG